MEGRGGQILCWEGGGVVFMTCRDRGSKISILLKFYFAVPQSYPYLVECSVFKILGFPLFPSTLFLGLTYMVQIAVSVRFICRLPNAISFVCREQDSGQHDS